MCTLADGSHSTGLQYADKTALGTGALFGILEDLDLKVVVSEVPHVTNTKVRTVHSGRVGRKHVVTYFKLYFPRNSATPMQL